MSNIQSIERAFSILEIVSNESSGVRLTDIIPQVDLPKSTVARILSTLEELGAVERHPDRNGYRIGNRILDLAMQPSHIVTRIKPYLNNLAIAADESVVLVLPDEQSIYFADQIHSHHRLQVREWTGQRQTSLHADSAGKVFLAFWPEERREAYLAYPLSPVTPHTRCRRSQLRQHLAGIRQQGYAWAHEELEEGLSGVSAPIFDRDDQILAAVNITGPTFRLPAPNENQELTDMLVETCQQITQMLRQ